MIDGNWTRWTKASFAEYFRAGCETLNIGFLIENEQKDVPATNTTYLELGIIGPNYEEITAAETKLTVNIQLGLHVALDSKLFTPEYYAGRIQALCSECIALKKIGLPEDDASVLGFFSRSKSEPRIKVIQIPPKNQKVQIAEFIILANFEVTL